MSKRVTNLAATVVAVLMAAMTMSGAVAQPGTPVGVVAEADLDAAVTWLMSQQGEDGGFPGFSGESDPAMTADAVLALTAAGMRGQDTAGAILAAMEYLTSGEVAQTFAATGPGQAAKLVLATVATNGDPRDIGGVDALARVADGRDADSGVYGQSLFEHGLALMALAVTGSELPASATEALATAQGPDGGWSIDGTTDEGAADTNTTAMVVQALVSIGEGDSEMTQAAIAYLEGAIDRASGVFYQPGGEFPPDSSSTALVLQAAIATGQDVDRGAWAALQPALAGFQNDSGAFHYNADDTADNIFSTVQVIPAVAAVAFPIDPAGTEATPAASPVALPAEPVIARAA